MSARPDPHVASATAQIAALEARIVALEQEVAQHQAEAELRASAEQLQILARRLIEVHERERRHIARELHDEVGQVLTGLKLSLAAAAADAPPGLAAPLAEAQQALTELMGRVRGLSLDLCPALLDDLGLLPALDWLLERYIPYTGVQVELRHQGLDRRFPAEVESTAYRIIQEALDNVACHVGVTRVVVRLLADRQRLMLRIDDRGPGFELEAVRLAHPRGGLTGMLERVRLIGGLLTIETAPNAGTQIIAELPLPE
jgi:signal transduction histidine kinase